MLDIQTALKQKTELLCKGLFLDKELISYYKRQGFEIDYGRKGGAGPLGGRYFLLKDNKTLVNVVLWDNKLKSDLVLREKRGNYFQIYDTTHKKKYNKLMLIQHPHFYDLKTSDGIEMRKIALVHGVDCLASTIYQKCKYWGCGEACKFCGIELSMTYDTTVLEKNYIQMSEVITEAKKEGRCAHMTLTSGTENTKDKGVNRYIELLIGIRKNHPNLPLHVQIEALENLEYIKKLKEAGANTIGIHIEVLDEAIRKKITPGKSKIPYQLFEENWKYALEIFGRNQVETYILTGLGESKKNFVSDIEKVISLGVIPFITPVRSIPGKRELPFTNPETLLQFYYEAARLMKEYDVNPIEHKAGCVKCGGCSGIKEAYLAA
jgi:radical SAM protein (TIGR04043 family)